MKIKSVIVDDDAFARGELKELLANQFSAEVELMSEFENPQHAIHYIQSHQPQLIFLDIQMPHMTGFEMLEQLDTTNFEVIFCTSFDKYAIQAIKHSALDYLLKPIDETELRKAIERFKEKTEKTLTNMRLANLKHNMNAQDENHFQLIIPTKQGEHQFPAQDIVRCEADSNYTAIHLVSKKKFLASKTLGDIEEMLSREKFLRIHKSHLVNTAHITQLTSQDEVVMSDSMRIPISRRRLAEVKSAVRGLN
ncbi:MAG: LytR/AlgR family response regulator transcription factor [Flavobacteriales bacterium]